MRCLKGVLAAVILLGMAGCVPVGGRTTPIDYYWADTEDNLVIQVTTGDLTSTRVTDVQETPRTVTITVRSSRARIPMADIGYALNLNVGLHEPLASRRVIDGSLGQQVSLCRDVRACVDRGTRSGAGGPRS
jgi:hypothetical protein